MRSPLCAALLLCLCLSVPQSGRADARVPADAGWTDAAWIALDLGVVFGLKLSVPHAHQDGDRAELPQVDAWAVEWGTHDDALVTSNVGVGLGVTWAALHSALAGRDSGAHTGLAHAVTYTESVLTTLAVAEIAKQAVQRPRPCTYQTPRRLDRDLGCSPEDDDAYLSFFSGHTATAAAISATAAYWAVRDGSATRTALTVAAGVALTSAIGVERVRAGKHFLTDVLVGAAAGAVVGTLTPWLRGERATGRDSPAANVTPAALGLAGVF